MDGGAAGADQAQRAADPGAEEVHAPGLYPGGRDRALQHPEADAGPASATRASPSANAALIAPELARRKEPLESFPARLDGHGRQPDQARPAGGPGHGRQAAVPGARRATTWDRTTGASPI